MHSGGVAVLSLRGVIGHQMSPVFDVSTRVFGRTFQQLVNSPDIKTLLLDVDSHGGQWAGDTEL